MPCLVLFALLLLLIVVVSAGTNCVGGLSVSCGPYGCCPTNSLCYYSGAPQNITACCQSGFSHFCGTTKCCLGQCGPTTEIACVAAIALCNTQPYGVVCGNLGSCCATGSYCNGSWNYNGGGGGGQIGLSFCYNTSTLSAPSTPSGTQTTFSPTSTASHDNAMSALVIAATVLLCVSL